MSSVSLPLTFTALAVHEVGAPLSTISCTVASLASDELLVHLRYASINAMDPSIQQSNLFKQPLPFKLGYDFSGTVVAQGRDGDLTVGDEVFGFTSHEGGCFAQYLVVKRERAERRGAIPAREAGAYGIAYPTAYNPVVIVGKVAELKGKWAFIPGGAGGVGHFGVQIALAHGLKVISSAGKTASIDLLRQMGVQHIVDYSKEDVVQAVLGLTGGRGADFVFDSTCLPSSNLQSASCVASGGLFVEVSIPQSGVRKSQQVTERRGASFVAAGHAGLRDNGCGTKAVEWYEQGKVKPFVTKEVPFDAAEVQKAMDEVGAGKSNVGKVVVNIRG